MKVQLMEIVLIKLSVPFTLDGVTLLPGEFHFIRLPGPIASVNWLIWEESLSMPKNFGMSEAAWVNWADNSSGIEIARCLQVA